MASYVNTEGFQGTRYLARSWALLIREPGWAKRILILWLVILTPIIGLACCIAWSLFDTRRGLQSLLFVASFFMLVVTSIGVCGYIAEWGRLTAWGVPSSPSRSGGATGTYLKTGGRNVIIGGVWHLLWLIAVVLVAEVPLIGIPLARLMSYLVFPLAIALRVALLRAAIYQKISGGFKVSTIAQMVRRDPAGLLRILGIHLLGVLLAAIFFSIVLSVTAYLLPLRDLFPSYPPSMSSSLGYAALLASFFVALPIILVSLGVTALAWIAFEIVVCNAIGLWMRQFNVPAWRGNDDPLPDEMPAPALQYAPPQYQQPYRQQPGGSSDSPQGMPPQN